MNSSGTPRAFVFLPHGVTGKIKCEIIIIKHFAQCLAQSKHSVSINVYTIIIVDCQNSSDPHQQRVVSGLSAGTWKHFHYIELNVTGTVIKTGSNFSLLEDKKC